MGAYLMMFAAWGAGLPLPVLNLVAAVIYFFVNKGRSRFVAFHALQSLLSQIPVTIANLVAVIWAVRIIFWDQLVTSQFWGFVIFAAVLNVGYIALSLVALGRARRGRMFYIWVTGRVAFSRYYGPSSVRDERPVPPNDPPPGL